MKMLSNLLNGENPTPAQLWVIHGVTALAVIITLFQSGFGFVALLLAVVAADWFGGIIANSARSTRAYWASLPLWTAYAFVIAHLIECAVLWWFFGDNPALLYLWPAVFAKLAVFILGQIEHRRDARSRWQATTS